MDVFRRAIEALDAGETPALATVIAASGSTPRHPGAHMLVRETGEIAGTIGGGRVELGALEVGVEVARGAPARRVAYQLTRDLGMCCGGSMEVYVEPVAPSREAIVEALRAVDERRPCALVTPLDGGAKRVTAPVDARAAHVVDDALVEPILPRARLVLFGGGHVARAIGPLAASVGFDVAVCDDGEVAQPEAPPAWASAWIDSFELRDVERALGPLGCGDYVVILTRDHAIDQRVLERVLLNDALTYLGMIGSLGKVARFRRRLEAKGLLTAERWSRLHSPVGLDIGAETPAEIAVSIVAELVRERNRGA